MGGRLTAKKTLILNQYLQETYMYESSDLRKGLKIEMDNDPFVVVDFQFKKPGKGQSLYKCKLKNMITGAQFEKTFRSGDKFNKADLEEQEMEYLYAEPESYCFMNTTTYVQEFLSKEQVGDAVDLLVENTVCTVLFFGERAIGLTLPNFVNLRVTKSEPWAKGDTATGSTKPATLETGFEIQVPPFVDEGQMVKIDTRTREYVERVSE